MRTRTVAVFAGLAFVLSFSPARAEEAAAGAVADAKVAAVAPVSSEDAAKEASSLLKQAYTAAKDLKTAEALGLFDQAGKQALLARDWKALVDAGYGLSNLGEPQKSKPYFSAAYDLAVDSGDWKKLVATGFACASLPRSAGYEPRAKKCFVQAAKVSIDQREWRGLVQAGNGMMTMGEKERAVQFYNQAFDIVKGTRDAQGLSELEEAYTAVNDYGKIEQCRKLAGKPSAGAPQAAPMDLSVETEAKLESKPIEQQRAIHDAAQQEMARRDDYLLEKEKQKREIYTDSFYYYYGYPGLMFEPQGGYYASAYVVRRTWKKFSDKQIVIWATQRLE